MAKKPKRTGGQPTGSVASRPSKVEIRKLPTGVPGLDEILGGGLPEFSFNILAGAPGSGKTTMAHQLVFANATTQRPALYFTVLGESPIKMLRYQQQYTFFDPAKLNGAIRFINLSQIVLEQDLGEVLNAIVKEVEAANPAIVVVDSFRTALRKKADAAEAEVQFFVQQLAVQLTSWEATTFLIGEYVDAEVQENPVFTVADGVFWLSQVTERNSVVRKLQMIKLRGQASVPGLHTFRITEHGLQTFSRTLGLEHRKPRPTRRPRLSMGVPDLDEMMGGGIPLGDSLLVAGASGTGKSVLSTHFIAEGLKQREPGIMAVFEERPEDCIRRAKHLGQDLETPIREGRLKLLYLRPLDLSVDESLQAILDAVNEIGAKRLVIDSLVGFEMALAPGFRTDFRESLYRMMASLTNTGVTVLSTVELDESFTEFRFSHYMVSFLADDILRLRYVDIDGVLRRILTVIKMRDSAHSKDIREYEITKKGVELTDTRLNAYRALITGIPAVLDEILAERRAIEMSRALPPNSLALATASHFLMERSPMPLAELEGASHAVRYVNSAFCLLAGRSKQALAGKRFAETIKSGDAILAVLDRVYRTGEAETHTESEGPGAAYLSYAIWPVLDAEQRPAGVMMQVTEVDRLHEQASAMNEALLVSSVRQHELTAAAEELNDQLRAEIKQRRRAEGELRSNEERLELILNSATEYAIIALDNNGRIASWNNGAERLLGYAEAEALGQPGSIFFTPADRASHEAEKEMRKARHDGRAANERWHTRKDGSRFWGSGVMLPMRNGEGVGAYLKIFRDRTLERQAEARRALLIDELNHRVKNTLATVQSIASQTLRNTDSPEAFFEALQTRLFSISRAHDLLTRESWEGAGLADVARAALDPWLAGGRISISGPAVRLRSQHALALSMAMNELATNAVKYGALSVPDGRVAIKWRRDRLLEMVWAEKGGPKVSPPARKGFGSRVLNRALAAELGGDVDLRFDREGATCLIRFDPGEASAALS